MEEICDTRPDLLAAAGGFYWQGVYGVQKLLFQLKFN